MGHFSRVDASQDHPQALQACILGPPKDWQIETILGEDSGGRSTSSQFMPGDSKAARFRRIGMAATRGDGYLTCSWERETTIASLR